MPSKNAVSNSVPAAKVGGIAVPIPADGWYFQTAIIDPRTIIGWGAGPNLHDGVAGDVATGYTHSPASNFLRTVAWLAVKQAGMTVRQIGASVGYANTPNFTSTYGSNVWSNNPGDWSLLNFDSSAAMVPRLDTFAWTANAVDLQNSADNGPFKYIVGVFSDSGGTVNQAGLSDIRLRSTIGGADVGP